MPTDSPCPVPELLASFADRTLAPRERGGIERHLPFCDACRLTVWSCVEPGRPASASRLPPRLRWVAAAVLTLAAAAALAYGWKGAFPGVRTFPSAGSGAEAWDFSGVLATAPAETRAVLLPEGTLLRLGGGTRLEALSAPAGERWHLKLHAGEVEASVSPGSGEASISTPAGRIEILGTRFRAKAFQLHLASSSRDALFVDLREGKVRLRSAQGNVVLRPLSRGLLLAGEAPTLQEGGQDSEKGLLDLIRTLHLEEPLPDDRPARMLMAVSLWGGGWKGSGSWSQALKVGESPRLREGAAYLMGLCASDAELQPLLLAAQREPDEALRRTFLRILRRRVPAASNPEEAR